MPKARDNVRIYPAAIEALAELRQPRSRVKSRNGPVQQRNHLDALSPSMRAFVLARCQVRGADVTAVLVVSADEVIIP